MTAVRLSGREDKSMTRKMMAASAVALGLVLLAVGLVLGLGDLHRDGIVCGSGFSGMTDKATQADIENAYAEDFGNDISYPSASGSVEADCKTAIGDRKTIAWAFTGPGIGIGLLALLWLVMVWNESPKPVAPLSNQPSSADELARLSEMHAAGALDDHEFAAAKARVLDMPSTDA